MAEPVTDQWVDGPPPAAKADGGWVDGPPAQADSGSHPLDAIGHAISSYWSQVNPVAQAQGVIDAVRHPRDTAAAMGQQNADLWSKAKDAYSKGDYVGAVAHGVNYALNGIPGLGSALDSAGEKFKSGDIAGGTGESLGLATNLALPAAMPAVTRAVGRGLQSAAVPVAESALGVRAIQRAYGKTPGAAALEETSGIRPATVASSARDRLANLNAELETAAAQSTTPASLQPARDVIATRTRTAGAGNSSYTPQELARMQSHLTDPQPGFSGAVDPATGQIATDQSPANILRMKREFGKDFTKWNPLNPSGEINTARAAYRALDEELDRTVPGADQLNQRISSLIPVAERGEEANLHAGIAQNVMHRAAAHTGALVGAAAGYHSGGIPGGIAGLVVPELLSAPATRMAVARGIHGAGKAAVTATAGRVAAAGAAAGAMLRKPDPLGLNEYLDSGK